MKKLLPALLCLLLATPAMAYDYEVAGTARVHDGDTLRIGKNKIRLWCIDAPELAQECTDEKGFKYQCGVMARDHLIAMIAGRKVTCSTAGMDRYKRTLSVCFVDGEDMNRRMVREGWAVETCPLYTADALQAFSNHAGIQQWRFESPHDFRHRAR